jgi:Flp pilus assembly protein CpaB
MPQRNAHRHPIKPARQRSLSPYCVAFAQERHKRGLECIVRVGGIVQQTPAHSQNHRTMSFDENGKCARVVVAEKALEQLTIIFLTKFRWRALDHDGIPVLFIVRVNGSSLLDTRPIQPI